MISTSISTTDALVPVRTERMDVVLLLRTDSGLSLSGRAVAHMDGIRMEVTYQLVAKSKNISAE